MCAVMAVCRKPILIVIDLDWTLWPFHVESDVDPPFKKQINGKVVDRRGNSIEHFPEVPKILEHLVSEGFTLAVASRTEEIRGAHQLLELFDWNKYFTYKEIYPGCKKAHFGKLKKDSGIDYKDMLFFDDFQHNIQDSVSIGVTGQLVRNGMNFSVIEEGLQLYATGKLR